MKDRPSYTAKRVASQRARLERASDVHGDPDAERRLYEGLGSPLLFTLVDSGRMRRRTEWFDGATVDALSNGVKQVLIIGAGYDGRALRFKGDGVRWIEVDHPATQGDKRRRMEALGVSTSHITFVTVDLLHDDLNAALAHAGHQSSAPSLFICEGLLGYLPDETVRVLFTTLVERSTPDTVLAANFRVVEPPQWIGDRVSRTAFDAILRALGETRLTEYHLGDPERLHAETGWTIDRTDISDRTRLDGRSHGLLVRARPSSTR
jgi:methyltransferase (TIGR00027 family)